MCLQKREENDEDAKIMREIHLQLEKKRRLEELA